MPIPNLFLDDLTQCSQGDLQQAIVALAQSGVEEKFRLDFKEIWLPEKQCPDIAAFANTYGGLLILGVADDRHNFPGIPRPSNSDLKTQIASVIATRIAPVPVFEVHTCPSPSDSATALAVIKVSAQPKIHMYLRGDKPVFIRNEDATTAARATDLQALLDRVRTNHESDRTDSVDIDIARDFYVTKATDPDAKLIDKQNLKNRTRSNTFLRISAAPERIFQVGLDSVMDHKFVDAIYASFPTLRERRAEGDKSRFFERTEGARRWYRYSVLDVERDHEAVWAFDNTGIIQFTAECSGRLDPGPVDRWSIVDLFVSMNGAIRLAQTMWTAMAYFGRGYFSATLEVPKLHPHINLGRYYSTLFYSTVNFGLPVGIAQEQSGNYEISNARGEVILNYDARTSRRAISLTDLGNQLLRDLRFSVDVEALNSALDKLPNSST